MIRSRLAVVVVLAVLTSIPLLSMSGQDLAGNDTSRWTQERPCPNPRLAAGLSVLVPGLGNFYAGEPLRGTLHFASVLGAAGMVVAAKISDTHDSITPFGWFAVLTLAGTYVWGIIDCALLGERFPNNIDTAISTSPPIPPSATSACERADAPPGHSSRLISFRLAF